MKKVILSLSVVLGILILWFAIYVAFSVKEKFEVLDKQLEKVKNEKTDRLRSVFKKDEEPLKKALSVRDSAIRMNQLIDSVRKELIEKYDAEIDNPK